MEQEEISFFIISNEPWGEMWYIKHHYAYELSRKHKVYFIDPADKWSPANLFSYKVKLENVNENLHVVRYSNNFPASFLKALTIPLNDLLNYRKLKPLFKRGRNNYIWQFDPIRFVKTSTFVQKRIYHVADPYKKFRFDPAIARKANLILCTSRAYIDHYSKLNPNVKYLPHGISADECEPDLQIVNELKSQYGKFFLHTGVIGRRHDYDLIENICEKFPDTVLMLLGPDGSVNEEERSRFERIVKRENVAYLGVKHGKELKNYIAAAACCLVLYRFDYNIVSNSKQQSLLKVLNYIAQAKPVVSTVSGEIEELSDKGLYLAANRDQYIEYLGRALEGSLPVDTAAVKQLLDKVSYKELIQQALSSVR